MSRHHLLKRLAAIKVDTETLEDRALEVATTIALSPSGMTLSELRERTRNHPLGRDPELLFTYLRYAEETYLVRRHNGVSAHPIYVVP